MSISRSFISSTHEPKENRDCYAAEWVLSDAGSRILTVRETIEGNEASIVLEGSLRSDTQFFFKDELTALATVDVDVIIDCSELKKISNACQKALIEVQHLMDSIRRGTLTLCKVPEEILKEFKASGADGSLNIE